jgi:hypothetical protein
LQVVVGCGSRAHYGVAGNIARVEAVSPVSPV